MGKEDGYVDFPTVTGQVGVENLGIGDSCNTSGLECSRVPLYTLDTYVRKFVLPSHPKLEVDNLIIDALMVDVEGFDWDVLGLGGANWTLPRTRYLEFEYHKVGTWPKTTLEHATQYLRDFGFVCYYAGRQKLWRLTDCFQEYFNEHRWSNVACVNIHLQPRLAARMELMFQKQLFSS